jgi:hypothetical protein
VARWLPPSATLVLVTALLAAYGAHPWSWVAGPIASLTVWALDRLAHKPAAPAPARTQTVRRATIPAQPERVG